MQAPNLEAKVTLFSSKKTLNFRGILHDLSRPLVMGILNVTPDSFYDGDRYTTRDSILKRVESMLEEGVDIIDIGGYSSRPGALDISEQEEIKRVMQALKTVKEVSSEILVSLDTFRSQVANAGLEAGADMINDISGGQLDPKIWDVVAKWQVPYVLMHMKGTPGNMASLTDYHNLLGEISAFFYNRIKLLVDRGINDIIIDPGFGFAKTIAHNYEILANLEYFKILGHPLLVGFSRKSMIYQPLETVADEALNGTTVLNTMALMNGAAILRVHDVKAAREAVQLFKLTYP